MDGVATLSLGFMGFAFAGFVLGRLSKADTIIELEENLRSLRERLATLQSKYESLTNRDERGRFTRRNHR